MRILVFVFLLIMHTATIASEHIFESWTEKGKSCVLQFKNAPEVNWDGKSELPLTFQKVRSIFNDWAKKTLAPNEEAHVTNYDLSSVAAVGFNQGFWVFKIRYVVFKNNIPTNTFNRRVAINLTGNVIEAICGI